MVEAGKGGGWCAAGVCRQVWGGRSFLQESTDADLCAYPMGGGKVCPRRICAGAAGSSLNDNEMLHSSSHRKGQPTNRRPWRPHPPRSG